MGTKKGGGSATKNKNNNAFLGAGGVGFFFKTVTEETHSNPWAHRIDKKNKIGQWLKDNCEQRGGRVGRFGQKRLKKK